MEKDKYLVVKIVGGVIIVAGATYGAYQGYKYLANKNNETGSQNQRTITLADGTTITVASDQVKPSTNEDANNLMAAFAKWVTAGKFNSMAQKTVGKNASRLSRYEIQNLTFLLTKADLTQTVPYGLTVPEETLLIADLKKLQ